jgi:hypothetical protein
MDAEGKEVNLMQLEIGEMLKVREGEEGGDLLSSCPLCCGKDLTSVGAYQICLVQGCGWDNLQVLRETKNFFLLATRKKYATRR